MSEEPGRNVGCLGRLLQLIAGGDSGGRGGRDAEDEPPFAAKDWLLSKAERSFLGVLDQAAAGLPPPGSGDTFKNTSGGGGSGSGGYRVFCKVRLGDVVYPRKGSVGIQGWRNRVDRKHLDFVIVTADALRPVAAVELDDASHGGSRAAERDAVKDRVLAAAGLPLVRIRARAAYGVEEVRMDLARAIAPAKK